MTALSGQLAAAFKNACLAELEALKPGNVHIFADGHGMVVQDFIRSADAASAEIARPHLSVGARILNSVEATWQAVCCNTNLGIVLLCAPLIHAALERETRESFAESLERVLRGLTVEDAVLAYAAIARAAPAGLGESARHDVRAQPHVTLLEAMAEATPRDRIAAQYVSRYADVHRGARVYEAACRKWGWTGWATTAVYLEFLTSFADTHLVRKFGMATAEEVREEATRHRDALLALENPKQYQRPLLDFDHALKARGCNPGTSADLTVASLLMTELEKRG
ncbi:MAG: triphosphoribosyl-dephospho-CoA synthase [Methylobacillus sp.]|jgi:triphosphoribosyl-dephospho-CoA synthase|nr:triphosphoribosyl-dephospho-CoA synthase [Methylobacillus sp.]